ncbi:MAG: MFS transporter [Chamaesiphon sp.]|nr:MFS transporter [Chamaesiphon sp.]
MTYPLSLKQKFLYSATSAGMNIISTTVSTWLLYFWAPPPDSGHPPYLDVALIGWLLTGGRFWDAVITPIVGHLSDTIKTPWGRRRPFLMFATPVMLISLILLWIPPSASLGSTNAIYFFGVTIAFYTSFHLVGIPYDSSLPEMGGTASERVSLSMWKNIFGTLGVLIGAVIVAPLFTSVGALGMSLVVATLGLISVLLTLTVLRETPVRSLQPMTLRSSLRVTMRNGQFLRLCLSNLMVQTGYAMLLANLPYFVTLVVARSTAAVSVFQGIVVIVMMVSAPFWNWLAHRYPHRRLLKAVTWGLAVTIGMNFFIGIFPRVDNTIAAAIALASLAPFLGGYFILIYAMMGSVVDDDELVTHQRREAFHYGTFSLSTGIGMSLSSLIVPQIFKVYGYTATNPLGVRVVFLAAAAIVSCGALALRGYHLGDSMLVPGGSADEPTSQI